MIPSRGCISTLMVIRLEEAPKRIAVVDFGSSFLAKKILVTCKPKRLLEESIKPKDEHIDTLRRQTRIKRIHIKPMQLDKPKTLKNGNPRGNPQSAPRCGAKTRRGTPCQAPALRGKKRCRMHGGKNPGRPRDPNRQMKLYFQAKRKYIKICLKCDKYDGNCTNIHRGEQTLDAFRERLRKYCRKLNSAV